jgi:hypothetical protein
MTHLPSQTTDRSLGGQQPGDRVVQLCRPLMCLHRTKMLSLAAVAMAGARSFDVCETALLLGDLSLLIRSTPRHDNRARA